jgi:hypothetical protein
MYVHEKKSKPRTRTRLDQPLIESANQIGGIQTSAPAESSRNAIEKAVAGHVTTASSVKSEYIARNKEKKVSVFRCRTCSRSFVTDRERVSHESGHSRLEGSGDQNGSDVQEIVGKEQPIVSHQSNGERRGTSDVSSKFEFQLGVAYCVCFELRR